MEQLIRRVDHVFVPVDDPEPLFKLFTDVLGLPVAWPVHDYGLFRSAGVTLGNCNVEFVAGSSDVNPFFEAALPATVRGIALEPAPGVAWATALDERRLRHTEAFPHEGKGARGHDGRLWTTMFIGGLVEQAAVAFLCAYEADECLRGVEAATALADAGGGVIGALRLTEITIGAQDYAKAERRWRRLLAPADPVEPGLWRLGDGPALRLKESPIDGVAGLTVAVRSLDQSREALLARGMLGPVRRRGMGLHYAKTGGLDVWLTE